MKALTDKCRFLVKTYIRTYRVYKAAVFFKLSGLPLQMLMYLFLWSYIARTSEVDFHYMVLYYLLTGLLSLAYPFLHISLDVEKDVMEGGLANCLVRPYPYILPHFAKYVAWMCLYSVIYIPVLIFVVVFEGVSLYRILLFFVCSVFGMLVEFMTWFLIGLLSLYFERINGFIRIIAAFRLIVSGGLLPLSLMPPFMQRITEFLPFRYYIYVPVNVLLQEVGGIEVLSLIGMAAGWIVFLSLASLLLWRKGVARMQANMS